MEIKGIGDRLADKIIKSFGGREEFLKAVKNFEVDRIAGIEGVSQHRAIEIVNSVLGNPTEEFLKTERAVQIYDDIVGRILGFASTKYAKNRILLMSPIKNEETIKESMSFVMQAKYAASHLPRDEIKRLLKKIDPTDDPKPKYDPSKAILVESSDDYHQIIELGLNSYCPVITSEELESLEDFELIVYVYSEGIMEFEDAYNITMVNNESEAFEIVPNTVLSYFKENYDLLRNILKIKEILGRKSIIKEVLDILDSLESVDVDETVFDRAIESSKEKADLKLKDAIKKVDLKGDEVLNLLNEEMPGKIQKIFDEVMKDARDEIKEETGCAFDPFIQKYPVEIDYSELERIKKQEMSKKQVTTFEEEVKAASIISKFKVDVESEIQEILLFDYEFALGCFAYYYDLHTPTIGDGFRFKEGLHLNLALINDKNIQKIDYQLESPENVVLLTGANSGGKTTLLETLAQISIMAQMGLPVCAQEAQVKLVDEVYFFSKKHSLDAGAFESFLRTFMPIVTREEDKLILLDELEAITELEAAVKIISSFMDFVHDSESFAIIVTHMAREILKYTDVRVDGIEAKGLDADYNLIVDRTPRMNHLAKSTPELILRRMYEKSDGKLQKIYERILEKF
ncbi:MutS-related protein [Methanobacterium paludis]|uniref:DNA-binding protein MutS2 n=1 Tax=Methanobacterium paludis (strain DSM 25820 / JCM 18151 / SWAN1) TaxID=868131 RepID=F6D5U2_METPW|nr:DNA mismatch repair protein MutS [Methanobacterium paludis]AEG18895.1 DNA mismatch repair protein MutS domain protein [Methanobacterium paludis]